VALQALERRLAASPHSEPSPNASDSQSRNHEENVIPKAIAFEAERHLQE